MNIQQDLAFFCFRFFFHKIWGIGRFRPLVHGITQNSMYVFTYYKKENLHNLCVHNLLGGTATLTFLEFL